MKATLCFSVVFWLAVGCADRAGKGKSDGISGTYTREYSFTVKHAETGADIGMRTIRDTIFVESEGDKYKVSNRKWMMNDYEIEGWRSMEHSDDRPFVSFQGEYDDEAGTLKEQVSESFMIYVDVAKRRLSKDKNYGNYYQRM